MDRQSKLLWMKDLLAHLAETHEQWEFADERVGKYLADSMARDLDECRRLCESLRRESDVARPSRTLVAV